MTQTIATSPSQSQRLIACGVDPKTADMSYVGGQKVMAYSKKDAITRLKYQKRNQRKEQPK